MPVETPSLFAKVIQDHLDLKQKNAELEPAMPLGRYKHEDPFQNHPLFKTEEQARIEETMDGEELSPAAPTALRWPGEETDEQAPAPSVAPSDDSLWGRSRDFDWGD